MTDPRDHARLLVSCPDRPGIVAAVSTFLADAGANIVSSAQHSTDPDGGRFLMRMEFVLHELARRREDLETRFGESVAAPFGMQWRLAAHGDLRRVAILASREEHSLLDQLWGRRGGERGGDLTVVVSNHDHHAADVAAFGVPFVHVPVRPDTRAAAEERILTELAGRCDLVVLARYMQILSGDFLERVGVPVINIHHSFLPAFPGADPHRRAHDRGVKIIGATAHYVTEQLDEGPIIEQDVARVTHREDVAALVAIGRDIERAVLARAVRWHLEERVMLHEDRTIVF
jgi:formyltetrahydrofolate deformylase